MAIHRRAVFQSRRRNWPAGIGRIFLLLSKILFNTWNSYKRGKDLLFRGVAFIIVRIMEPFCLIMALVIGVPHLEEQEDEDEKEEQGKPAPPHRRILAGV